MDRVEKEDEKRRNNEILVYMWLSVENCFVIEKSFRFLLYRSQLYYDECKLMIISISATFSV